MSVDVRVLPCLCVGVRMDSQRGDQSFTELEDIVRHHMQAVREIQQRLSSSFNGEEENLSNPEHPAV